MAISINGNGGTTGPYYERTSDLPNYNSAYTVCMWFRPSVVGTQWNGLFHLFYNTASSGDLFEIDDGVGNSVVYVSVNNVSARGTTALSADTWYHLAMVRESSTSLKGYLNGVLEATNTTNAGTRTAPNKMGTGWWDGSAWSDLANGRLAHYMIFPRALTADEITAQMHRAKPITQDVHSWWPFWNTSDDETDYSGNGRNWTVSGTPADADGPPVGYGAFSIFDPTPVWTPLLISGCSLWLDASDSSSITLSSGAVSQWNDKSGNARHFSQSNSTYRPTVSSAAQNGRDVVVFDGTNDHLTASSYTVSNTSTFFIVTKQSSLKDVVLIGRSDAQRQGLRENYGSAGNYSAYWGNDLTSSGTSSNFTVAHMVTMRVNSSSGFEWWRDSVSVGTNATGPAESTFAPTQIPAMSGVTYPQHLLNGWVAEVIIYNSALSTADRQTVEAYLQAKWMPAIPPALLRPQIRRGGFIGLIVR